MRRSADLATNGIGYFTTLFDKVSTQLIASLTNVVNTFDDYQKPLLSIGTNLISIPESIKSAALELPVGFNTAMGIIVESFKAGLFAVDKSSLELAARMKVNGEDSRILFSSLKTLTASLGTSAGGVSTLSKTLLSTSERHHITVTALINTLNSLQSTFEKIKGISDPNTTSKLAQDLTGAVGSANDKLITRFLSKFLDPSVESAGVAQLLGLGDLQNKVLSKGDVDYKDILAGISKANSILKEQVGDSRFMKDAINNIYGDLGLSLAAIDDTLTSMDLDTKNSLAIQTDFQNSWKNFMDTIGKPLAIMTTKAAGYLLTMVTKFPIGVTAGFTLLAGLLSRIEKQKFTENFSVGKATARMAGQFGLVAGGLTLLGTAAYEIYSFFKDKDTKDEVEQNKKDLEEQAKIASESSRFSTMVRDEVGASLRSIQLYGEKQNELLTVLVDAVRDGTADQIKTAKALASQLGYIKRSLLGG
jgi:hypothetical protein